MDIDDTYPEYLREQLHEIYRRLDGLTIGGEWICTLLRQCVSSVGFVRGCVYLVEPENRVLAPRMTIGDAKVGRYQSVRYDGGWGSANPIAQAYNSGALLVSGAGIVQFAGVIGSIARVGVLQLEIPRQHLESRERGVMNSYYAISRTLGDCLNIQ